MKSREHLGIARIGAARTHVISQALLEQSIVLEHERNGTHQLLGRNSSHIRPAHKNDTLICVPKARDERRERRLASARRPDESHRRPGGNGKRHVAKRRFPGPRIREADARKLDARLLRMESFGRLHLVDGSNFHDRVHPPQRVFGDHDRLRRIHDLRHHRRRHRREKRIEQEVNQKRREIRRDGGKRNACRYEHRKGRVDRNQLHDLGSSAILGIVRRHIAIVDDRLVERLERKHRLLEYLYHGYAANVFGCRSAHAHESRLVKFHEMAAAFFVLAAHHPPHRSKGNGDGDKAQKPHPPVEQERHDEEDHRGGERANEIGQLMGDEVFCLACTPVDHAAHLPRRVHAEISHWDPRHVANHRFAHICRNTESRQMRSHERTEIHDDAQHGKHHSKHSPHRSG